MRRGRTHDLTSRTVKTELRVRNDASIQRGFNGRLEGLVESNSIFQDHEVAHRGRVFA